LKLDYDCGRHRTFGSFSDRDAAIEKLGELIPRIRENYPGSRVEIGDEEGALVTVEHDINVVAEYHVVEIAPDDANFA